MSNEADKARRRAQPGSDTTAKARANLQATSRYVARLRRQWLPLPASLDRPHELSVKLAAAESDVAYQVLIRSKGCRKILLDAIADLDVAPRRPPRLNKSHRLCDLENLADARLEEEGDETVRAQVLAAIGALAKAHGTKADAATALAGAGMADDGALGTAARLLADAQRGLGVPETFAPRFRYQCALVGTVPRSLARLAGYAGQTLANWGKGRKTPNRGTKPAFERIEDFLGLMRGDLWDRVAHATDARGRIRGSDLPAHCATRYQRERSRLLLPEDFSARLPEEQEELRVRLAQFEAQRKERPSTKLARARRDRYKLKEVPAQLDAELAELFAHRGPQPMLLGNLGKGWNVNSINKWRHRFLLFFGFLAYRLHQLEQVPAYQGRGPFRCIAPEALCLAQLMLPQLVVAYGRWLTWRKTQFGRKATVTADEIELLKELERLTRPRGDAQAKLDNLFL